VVHADSLNMRIDSALSPFPAHHCIPRPGSDTAAGKGATRPAIH
jgi:hypothetical protein